MKQKIALAGIILLMAIGGAKAKGPQKSAVDSLVAKQKTEFAKFVKEQKQKFQEFKARNEAEFAEFSNQQNGGLSDRDSANAKFATELAKPWTEFQLKQKIVKTK
ncbi:MAG: hypothetical protein LBJ73_04185 [Rickettsiales bacterium]|jgi:hypothetical protein|nr:hypothetical protein [Rickettsiales bacterium]